MQEHLSAEAYERLRKELEYLKGEGRRKIAQQLKEAREKGDLSENAEYDAAKEAQAMLEQRIAKLESILARAKVIDKSKIDTSRVNLLTNVKLKNLTTGQIVTFKIVSESEANVREGKISVKSPIGAALLGKKKGEIVEVQVPAGKVRFEILDITI